MFDNIPTKQSLDKDFFKNLSLRQQYILYTFSSNFKKGFVSSVFSYLLLLYSFRFINMGSNRNYRSYYYALIFFFSKTFSLFSVLLLNNNFKSTEMHQPDLIRKLFKWKTGSYVQSTTNFFLNQSGVIVLKYSKLNFLESLNTTLFVQTGSKLVDNSLVLFSKTLLSKPLYNSSSINKHLYVKNLNTYEFQFLRKNKVYNKGRYSRCRQNYRTGVYMCMYLSVISIFGLYFWFYKFSFNFTYLWWFFISFVASFFIPKIIKYRFYEPITLFNSFLSLFKWTSLIIKSFFSK